MGSTGGTGWSCFKCIQFPEPFFLKDQDDSTVYAWYFETVRLVVFAFVAIFDWHCVITGFSVVIFILLGVTEWLSAFYLMRMHSFSHLSISTILSRTRLIWVPILGFLLIHETLSLLQYAGILVLFLGIVLTISPKKLFVDAGAIYANMAAFFIALNVILTKIGLSYASISVVNAVMVIPSVILFPLLMQNARKRIVTMVPRHFLMKTLAIGINIISVYLSTIALRVGDASRVTAIYQGMLIFSVLAGILILHERQDIFRKISGAAIALVGVFLLS